MWRTSGPCFSRGGGKIANPAVHFDLQLLIWLINAGVRIGYQELFG
jgi:hypothetical protein